MELSKLHPDLQFIQVEAENFPNLVDKFEIDSVPTFVFFKKDTHEVIHRMTGANPMELSTQVNHYSQTLTKKDSHVHPHHHPILTSSSPLPSTSTPSSTSTATPPSTSSSSSSTSSSSLATPTPVLPSSMEPSHQSIPSELKHRIATEPILVFMKGHPDQPRCGFSNQMVQLLRKHQATFKFIDVLENETIRQGMKTYSNWPTFPQLYVQGEFIGGVDILKELDESGNLKDILAVDDQSLTTRLRKLIHQSPIMIFIKGTPSLPKCGFSNQLVSILDRLRVKYDYFDILTDETIRQGLKEYSNWPTYPQVYVEGELVGGLDIVQEMLQVNEFQTLVQPYIVQSW
ncbi:Glutaredoxin 3 [Coelomomyces lativittatus]|nr:Glutaredoxin 3 [Coelomomyces lativittatus]